MKALSDTEFLSGMLFILLGCAALFLGRGLAVGNPANMGPGFFPMALSTGLVLIGIVKAAQALRAPASEVESEDWRPVVVVTTSLIAFGLTVSSLGLLCATALLVGISALASNPVRWLEVVLAGVLLFVAAYLIFVVGLKVNMRVLPV